MRRFQTALVLAILLVASSATAVENRDPRPSPRVAVPGPGVVYTSSGSARLPARETAGPDTFAIYGGPDRPTEGKFQLIDGHTPDWGDGSGLPAGYGGGAQAWKPVDLTYDRNFWHRDTFNAENLNGNGPGNHAMWCGLAADDPDAATWAAPPGYGNNWLEDLIYESAPVADPGTGQVVTLDFYFNYSTEPGFDIFSVAYDSAGTWKEVGRFDGTNQDQNNVFPVPGVRFSDVQLAPIAYDPGGYGLGDRIRIRLRFDSDGAWSNQDGLFPTNGAAVQVDDISLTTSQGSWAEDFEGTGPWLFEPDQLYFAGDFADVYPRLTDIDPCRENPTPAIGFIDYDQVVRNGPSPDGLTHTGGTTHAGVEYGVPGNYVVNYTGGLSLGLTTLHNEIWSPAIAWDLPGTDDDSPEIAGAKLAFTVWADLPLSHSIFYYWKVRVIGAGYYNAFSGVFSESGLRYSSTPGWDRIEVDVSRELAPFGGNPTGIQIALGVQDYPFIDPNPVGATPSPVFDDVAFYKYRVGGPAITAEGAHLAQDQFPPTGSIDVSSPASRDALDVPFDMAADINSGSLIIDPGDSVVVDARSLIAGATLTDLRMVWTLDTNPLFEDALRAAPARSVDVNVVTGPAGSVWTGEVLSSQVTDPWGSPISNRFFFDLPDADFMYPGDRVQYYFQATDSDGRVTTLPADVSGFGDFSMSSTFDRAFTVRALPSIADGAGAQPEVLVVNGYGHRGGENEWMYALGHLGLEEGTAFDTYTVKVPTSLESNGIGAAGGHGATAAQLAGYGHILYFGGDLSAGLLSDGSYASGNGKSDDIGLLEQWGALAAPRNVAFFGDNVVSATAASPSGANFVGGFMGVDLLGPDVRPALGGQTAPLVVPNGAGTWAANFSTSWVAYGGCPTLNRFDQIQPLAPAEAGHWFCDATGAPITDPGAGVASVINPRANGITVVFSHAFFENFLAIPNSTAVEFAPRELVLQEVLDLFNVSGQGFSYTPSPEARRPAELTALPNPFNPATTIEFTAAAGARGSVRVYNLRGELVRTLHTGEFQRQRFEWDGRDERGAAVASGVYVVRAEDGRTRRTLKVALVK